MIITYFISFPILFCYLPATVNHVSDRQRYPLKTFLLILLLIDDSGYPVLPLVSGLAPKDIATAVLQLQKVLLGFVLNALQAQVFFAAHRYTCDYLPEGLGVLDVQS